MPNTCTDERAVDLIVFHDEMSRLLSDSSGGAFGGMVELLCELLIMSFVEAANVITLPTEMVNVDDGHRYRLMRDAVYSDSTLPPDEYPYTRNLCLLDTHTGFKVYANTLASSVAIDKEILKVCIRNQIV